MDLMVDQAMAGMALWAEIYQALLSQFSLLPFHWKIAVSRVSILVNLHAGLLLQSWSGINKYTSGNIFKNARLKLLIYL
jgi:hypothetical protein